MPKRPREQKRSDNAVGNTIDAIPIATGQIEEKTEPQSAAAEAQRQSRAIAARATDPGSEEAAVLRELDEHLVKLGKEWR